MSKCIDLTVAKTRLARVFLFLIALSLTQPSAVGQAASQFFSGTASSNDGSIASSLASGTLTGTISPTAAGQAPLCGNNFIIYGPYYPGTATMTVTGATFNYKRSGIVTYQICGSYKTVGFADGSGYTVNCFPYNDFPDANPDIPLTTPPNCYATATIIVSASTKITVTVGGASSVEELLGNPSQPAGNQPALCLCVLSGASSGSTIPYVDFAGGENGLGATNSVGDPISVATGNLYESAVDYATAGQNVLMFARYYNSQSDPGTAATSLGSNWRSNFDRYIRIETASAVMVERADGQELPFTFSNGVWASDTDVDEKLTNTGSTWTLVDRSDATETFTAINSTLAILASWRARSGYTQTMSRSTSHQLTGVTDSFGRTLSIGYYPNGLIEAVANPDGQTITYTYGSSGVTAGVQDQLATVIYPTSPPATLSYLYENSSLPFALTGVMDEDGKRYATWTYDIAGRALSSFLGGARHQPAQPHFHTTTLQAHAPSRMRWVNRILTYLPHYRAYPNSLRSTVRLPRQLKQLRVCSPMTQMAI